VEERFISCLMDDLEMDLYCVGNDHGCLDEYIGKIVHATPVILFSLCFILWLYVCKALMFPKNY